MTGRLEGKVAVVTGGARGIGQAIAENFARNGAQVVAADKSEPAAHACALGAYRLDVTDPVACEAFFAYMMRKYGKIDILVNNAGIVRDALTQNMTVDMWRQVVEVNLSGAFYLTRSIGPHMQTRGGGSIINISSIVGEYGNIGQANYAASKSGLVGLTKTWAKEFARNGGNVRVNAIAPGYVETEMLQTVPPKLLERFSKSTMLGRLGKPQEIADAALFLASEESSYITGHVLQVNGGLYL